MHTKKVRYSFLLRVLAILVWLAACSQPQQGKIITLPTAKTRFPTPQILPSATNTVRPSPIPPTQTLIPTLQPKPNCPAPRSKVTIPEAETESEVEKAIMTYLNQGGYPERLQNELKHLEDIYNIGPSEVIMVDINDDGINEIVLAINFGPAPVGGDYLDIHGNLYIYNCADGKYHVIQVVAGEFADTLKILTVENLLSSEAPEILISRRWIYLDSYYEFVELYMLTDKGWALTFQSPDFRCGIQAELKNRADGRKELIITGSNRCPNDTDASATGEKLTYELEENEVKLIQEELFPSP